jgi:hypothetical protein
MMCQSPLLDSSSTRLLAAEENKGSADMALTNQMNFPRLYLCDVKANGIVMISFCTSESSCEKVCHSIFVCTMAIKLQLIARSSLFSDVMNASNTIDICAFADAGSQSKKM